MMRFVVASFLLLSACARGEITLPSAAINQVTVDASAFVYVDLGTNTAVAQADAKTSTTWDIGFNGTTVVLNGGTTGPVGVTGYCLCQNAAASSDQILAFTPENQSAAFSTVTATSIPATTIGFSSDVFTTSTWYKYNLAGDNKISPTFDVYLIKRGASTYKLQLIDYYGPAGETRRVTFRSSKLS